jgi:alkylhydroperoxidase family enzyme
MKNIYNKPQQITSDTFLPPIENPHDPIMKMAYGMTRQQFGKVLTPLKVVYARMPPEFGQFATKIGERDQRLSLPEETAVLIRQRVAGINVCSFCIDIGRSVTIEASMNQAKFDALEQYSTSLLFTDAERAALDYVTELTNDKKVNPDTFAGMARYYSEREICEIVCIYCT